MNRNLLYSSEQISNFYSKNRIKWEDFYESEKHVLNRLKLSSLSSVLDVGCGCGGLGLALCKKFGVKNYVGIEINNQAVEIAQKLSHSGSFICADILNISKEEIGCFDVVCSLSCIDWNIELNQMLAKCWSLVSNSGVLVLSLRLTKDKSLLDISKSFQRISFDKSMGEEIAQYSVLNIDDCVTMFCELPNVGEIYGFGYMGKPSKTAVTPYKELCFAVFSIKKDTSNSGESQLILDLPFDLNK